MNTNNKNTHHSILNHKGGSCKTTTAVYVVSYYTAKGIPVKSYDTEPTFPGLEGTEVINSQKILTTNIYSRELFNNIDGWINALFFSDCDTITDISNMMLCVLSTYLQEIDFINTLKKNNKIIFHVPFYGNIDSEYFLKIKEELMKYSPENAEFVYWEHLSPISLQTEKVQRLGTGIKLLLTHNQIKLLNKMMKSHKDLNYKDFYKALSIMDKYRYTKMRKQVYSTIEDSGVVGMLYDFLLT